MFSIRVPLRMKILTTLSLCLIGLIGASTFAQNLSPEQKAKINALPPSLRAQAMAELEKYQASQTPRSERLEQPDVVIPYQIDPRAKGAFEASNPNSTTTIEETPEERKTDTDELEPFGYDLFAGSPTTFAPVTEIPIPVDYVIGPGDQVRIQFFGKESSSYDLYVTRDGLLQIPELGPIAVAGQRFTELKEEISQRVAEQMIGIQAFVTMGELRSIRVFILGDVNRPGSYSVSSLSTMVNALFVSGGIKPIGTLRNIQLKRQGDVVGELDLYDLLLNGDTSGDARLQPGDVIFVPPVGQLAGVSGEVKRPAIYELTGNESTIRDLVDMAGGFSATAYTPISQLERIAASGLKEVKDLDLSQQDPFSTNLRDGDLLRVFSNLERTDNVVILEGQAERPGTYEWSEGMQISDLVDGYDAIVPSADLQYALVVSRNLFNGQISVRSFSLESALADEESPNNLSLRKRDRILIFQDATFSEIDGETAAEDDETIVAKAEEDEEEEKDSSLKRSEMLAPIIAALERQATSEEPEKIVEVSGFVRNPGRYPLEENMTLKDLVRAAGGFSQDAFTLEAELIRFEDNQKRQRETILLPVKLESGGSGLEISLRSFDQLLVKRIPDWGERENITLRGEIKFPGTYTIERGETLSSVLRRAGGITELAYPHAAVFFRESLRKSELEQIQRLRNRMQEDISSSQFQQDASATESIETAKNLVEQLDSAEALGRLVIDLPAVLDTDSSHFDITLRAGDELIVPQKPQSVTIIGSVNYPTSHFFDPGLNRDDYIGLSGGLLKRADKQSIYVVRANGRVENLERSRFFPRSSQKILAGDTIVVPIDVDRMKPLRYWGEVSQIIYQLALGAAAVNSF